LSLGFFLSALRELYAPIVDARLGGSIPRQPFHGWRQSW